MSLATTIKDILHVRIQGAQAVELAAVKALYDLAKRNPAGVEKAYAQLIATRPTEPGMRNALQYLLQGIREQKREEAYAYILEHWTCSAVIAEHIAQHIKDGMVVYTHCHSGTVVNGLLLAKKQGKRFSVNNTETRPLFQGRKTAAELARAGIPVTHFVDSGMRLAIKDTQLVLLGADAITAKGEVYNKIGSELACLLAKQYAIPAYICTDSWKFDPKTRFGFDEKIEKRHAKEVWSAAPQGVRISNYAFEKIDAKLITGIITEIGVLRPKTIKKIVKTYSWLGR
ncbi:MAG: translation initiation factor eIF-2B subunit [archaeon]